MTHPHDTPHGEHPRHRRQETYKHLQDPLRPGGLTLGQWATVALAALAAIVFALYISPLPPGPTISVSILLAGAPGALSYAAGGFDLSIADSTRAVWLWARGAKHYLPGAGVAPAGYIVTRTIEDQLRKPRAVQDVAAARQRLESAWDS